MSLRPIRPILAASLLLAAGSPANGASHLWVINEVFSNADGTVQFIEMHVPTNSADENRIGTRWVRSTAAQNQFDFPGDLPAGSTAFAYLLLATQGFADLPGAPVPDYILPDGFFDPVQEDIEYWMYVVGDLAFSAGQLPLDGFSSLDRFGSTAVNSPTNFNGVSGSVNLNATDVPALAGAGASPLGIRLVTLGGNAFSVEFSGDGARNARVDVLDVTGRRVRDLYAGPLDGSRSVTWSGTDAQGRGLGSGVYFVRLTDGESVASQKAAIVR